MKVNSMISAALLLMMTPIFSGCIKPAAELGGPVPSDVQSGTSIATTPDSKLRGNMLQEIDAPPVTTAGGTGNASANSSAQEVANTRKYRNNSKRLFQLGELSTSKLTIGKHEFNTWVMDDDLKRAEGMMWLENSDFLDNDSMTFVYNEEFQMSFWMRNTLVDLDIAFLDAKFNIVRVTTMKKLDETQVPSRKPAMYAIEFRAGLLKKKGITDGMKVKFADPLKSQD